VLFCVLCLFRLLCLIVVPLPPGTDPFAVKINNNNTKIPHCVIIVAADGFASYQSYAILSINQTHKVSLGLVTQ
jgi:hypothetical protein